ncbi:hypothetical protein AB5I41_13680 [Sphingomonas sp. MMS24-JH45]
MMKYVLMASAMTIAAPAMAQDMAPAPQVPRRLHRARQCRTRRRRSRRRARPSSVRRRMRRQ